MGKKPISKEILVMDDEVQQENCELETNADRYIELNGELTFGDNKVVFVKAPKGSGKTQKIKAVVARAKEQSKTVMLVGHRRFLISDLAKRVDLDNYQDVDEITDTYAFSVDSLFKIDPNKDKCPEIVIIDESEQVLQHIISPTFKDKRAVVFNNLAWLLRTAQQVICLDADLSTDLTIDIVSWLRGITDETSIYGFINDWQADGKVEMYDSDKHLLAQLMVDITAGKNVFVPVGSLKLAENIETILANSADKDGNPFKVLCLTSQTNDSDAAKAFIGNPTEESQKYQVVIASPTLSTGVSIEGKHFDVVYGFFNNKIYTYQDCDQAISRVRNCETVRVWIQSSELAAGPLESKIVADTFKKEIDTKKFCLVDEEFEYTEGEKTYVKIFARITHRRAKWMCNKRAKFTDMKIGNGFEIVDIEKDKDLAKEGKALIDFAKEINHNKHVKAIFNAEILERYVYEEQKNKKGLTNSEYLAVVRFSHALFIFPDELTVEKISDIISKNLMKKGARMRNALSEKAVLAARDLNERDHSGGMITDYHHRGIESEEFKAICGELKMDYKQALEGANTYITELEKLEAAEATMVRHSRQHRALVEAFRNSIGNIKFEVSPDDLDKLGGYVASNLEVVNRTFSTDFKTPTDEKSKMKVWNGIFGNHGGLQLKKVKDRADGNNGVKYLIDYDHYRILAKKVPQYFDEVGTTVKRDLVAEQIPLKVDKPSLRSFMRI